MTGLWFVQNSSMSAGGELINKESQEINLNEFLSGYNNNLYEKIELKDGIKLQGYQLLTGAAEPNILGIVPDKNYKIRETNKPVDTALEDL